MADVRLPADGTGVGKLRSRMLGLACLMLTSFDDAPLDAITAGAPVMC